MVHCIVVGCRTKTNNSDGVGMFRIPAVIANQGEEYEKLTLERKEWWISAVSRADTKTKDVLKSERVCGKHFVSGRPAMPSDRYNEDWVPSKNLGKKEYRKKDGEAAKKKADRVKLRGQIRQQREQEARTLLEQKERDKRIQDQELLEQQERAIRIQKDGLLDQQERKEAAKRLKLN